MYAWSLSCQPKPNKPGRLRKGWKKVLFVWVVIPNKVMWESCTVWQGLPWCGSPVSQLSTHWDDGKGGEAAGSNSILAFLPLVKMKVKASCITFVSIRNKLWLSLQGLSSHLRLCWSHQLAQMDLQFNYKTSFSEVRRTENSVMFSNEFGTGSKCLEMVLLAWVEPRFGLIYTFEGKFA